MALATSVTTSGTDVNKIWRKVQGDLYEGMNFFSEEFGNMERFVPDTYDIDISAREITVPVDLNEEVGVAAIPEGGYEAVASSVNVEEVTLGFTLLNARFSASVTARILDERHRAAELKRQIVFQGMKKMQALARTWSDMVYGYSTNILALTDTDLSGTSDTLTLYNGLNDSTIAGSTAATGNYIANLFRVGERIAALNAGSLATNALGEITAITAGANPTIAVTWDGSTSESTNGLQIVLANSVEGSTIAATAYNRGIVGYLDLLKSTSVHGTSSSSVPNWSIAGSDTSGGRLSGVRLRAAKDALRRYSPMKPDFALLDEGVHRDLIDLERAALRFSDPFALETDGDVKSKDLAIRSSWRVPPGYAIVGSKKAFARLDIMPKPGQGFAWGDGHKMENQSGYLFPVDFLTGTFCKSRKAFFYFSGLDRQ